MDFLKNLPQVEETPTNNDLQIIKFLIDESKKLKGSINIKQVIVATVIFVILLLPSIDTLIRNKISDNPTSVIFIKALVFCVAIIFINMIVK
jgi:hypothetical protein